MESCLTLGLTKLRGSGIHDKGSVYSGLFNLAIGFERLLKIIIIMDHMLKHDLTPPSNKLLKELGHNIWDAYTQTIAISETHGVAIPKNMDTVDTDIMNFLSEFGKNSRYYNLDAIGPQKSKQEDRLVSWHKILENILQYDVPKKSKAKANKDALITANAIQDIAFVIAHDFNQKELGIHNLMSDTKLQEKANQFVILRIVKILNPLKTLIANISDKAYLYPDPAPFPAMQEFLEKWLDTDKQYVLRKKKWP